MKNTIFWFRQDLRLHDNAALSWAAQRGTVTAVYIDDSTDPWTPGGASRWWLYHAIQSLAADCALHGLHLTFMRGDPRQILPDLVQQAKADAVCWNRCYEPHAVTRDTAIKEQLRQQGLTVTTHKAALLFEPWEIKTKTGTAFKVFTPYYRACIASTLNHTPLPSPQAIHAAPPLQGERLEDWNLLPATVNWAQNFPWQVSESAAEKTCLQFLHNTVCGYKTARDLPSQAGTSQLSPYLHFGQISPRQIWHHTRQSMHNTKAGLLSGGESFLREIIWREFCYHLLYTQPHMPEEPLHPTFKAFPWRDDHTGLKAWQQGQTGYPIIDAGMRQLWQTGWMHNRVRMIAASFLVKDLLLPWQAGARWFWDTLVDADLANNAAGWQWVAGCGADAAPYFRIFNPRLQSERFDVHGDYIRRYVPELSALPAPYIHEPATAPLSLLQSCGIELGETYPQPILDHKMAKTRALAALKSLKNEN